MLAYKQRSKILQVEMKFLKYRMTTLNIRRFGRKAESTAVMLGRLNLPPLFFGRLNIRRCGKIEFSTPIFYSNFR